MNEVVVTGMGACTSTAPNVPALWNHVAHLGTVQTDKPRAPFGPSPAVSEALRSARLSNLPNRLAFLVSASKPLIADDGSITPPERVGERLCAEFQIEADRDNIVAACATGAYSIAAAASRIAHGEYDIAIAGSVEAPAHPLFEAGFRKMGVLTDHVMRPFDRDRCGFVLGAGAGIVILESRKHAEERGAPIQARLTGWGLGSDPHSPVAFNSNGEHIAQVIRKALKRAGVDPAAVRHVNAHGTATRLNDWIETQALIKAFGADAPHLMISGTKSTTGHLLGAAGSVEFILMVKALQEQFIPPTAHLENPDPECPLDFTPSTGHAATFEHALSLSFGFGGPIGALIVSRS